MAELESDIVESTDDAQAVQARFNPWWIIGAMVFVVAVILGFRALRAPAGDAMIPNADDDVPKPDEGA